MLFSLLLLVVVYYLFADSITEVVSDVTHLFKLGYWKIAVPVVLIAYVVVYAVLAIGGR